MATTLFLVLLAAIALGVPIASALGLASATALLAHSSLPVSLLAQRIFVGLNSFPLLAAPLFILAGALMETGGISDRITRLAHSLVGHIRGGLGMVVVVGTMIFSGISGSSTADTAAIGSVMIPTMVKRGYPRPLATGASGRRPRPDRRAHRGATGHAARRVGAASRRRRGRVSARLDAARSVADPSASGSSLTLKTVAPQTCPQFGGCSAMIDLAQRSEPYEIALPYGLSVTVKPLTTAGMAAAQAAARRSVEAIERQGRERNEAGLALDGLPDLSAEGERDGFYQAQLIRELAARHVTTWTGVELEGGPAPPTPGNVAAVMQLYPVGERFFQEFTLRQVLLNAAKNGCGPSAAGTSSPAEGPNTVGPARRKSSPAPEANPEPIDSAAPTASTP